MPALFQLPVPRCLNFPPARCSPAAIHPPAAAYHPKNPSPRWTPGFSPYPPAAPFPKKKTELASHPPHPRRPPSLKRPGSAAPGEARRGGWRPAWMQCLADLFRHPNHSLLNFHFCPALLYSQRLFLFHSPPIFPLTARLPSQSSSSQTAHIRSELPAQAPAKSAIFHFV